MIKKNETAKDLRIKMSKLHGMSKTAHDDHHEEGDTKYITTVGDAMPDIKATIVLNQQDLREQKQSYLTDIKKMQRRMNFARDNIFKITDLKTILRRANSGICFMRKILPEKLFLSVYRACLLR